MTTSASDAAAQATQYVRQCKANLYHALQRRHRDAWRTYWSTFQQYLLARTSLEHFHSVAEELLGPENMALHNTFVVALLQDCSVYRPTSTDTSQHTDTARQGHSTSVDEIKSEEVVIKSEFPARVESPDTESAQILMGLGRFVSH